MKIRKISRKLVLNKETIANLNNGQMGNAYGGAPTQIDVPKTVFPPPDPTSCVCTAIYTNCATETTSIPPEECCLCDTGCRTPNL